MKRITCDSLVTSMESRSSGRFAHIFEVTGEYRMRYGKATQSVDIITGLSLEAAQDLAALWVDGCNTDDMDYAIECYQDSQER